MEEGLKIPLNGMISSGDCNGERMLKPTQDKEATLTDEEFVEAFKELEKENAIQFQVNMPWSWGKQVAKKQIAKLEKLGYHKGLPSSIEEALNSGDCK